MRFQGFFAVFSTIGGLVGGPVGAAMGLTAAQFFGAHAEARMEQADVYEKLVTGGMSEEEAQDKSFKEVYAPNVLWLSASNFVQGKLTFGALRGKKFLAKLFNKTLDVVGSSAFEGAEEVVQGLIRNNSLALENDWGQLRSFRLFF